MPRLPRLVLFVLLALACTFPSLIPAAQAAEDQEPWLIRVSREKSRTIPPRPLHFTGVTPGRKMRVESGQNVVEGPFQRFVADTLWLASSAGTEGVPLAADSIRTVWTRGNGSGKGALIGGLVGGVLMLAYLGAFEASDSQWDAEYNYAGAGGMGLAGGAFLGALIGSTATRWHQRYP